LALVATVVVTLVLAGGAAAQETRPSSDNILGLFLDRSGVFGNAADNPAVVHEDNAFFDPQLGTNGQACVTCHQPTQGFSLVVPFIRERFASSQGRDPLFRANDTADRPDADLSTVETRREAFALLLSLGVIRIGKTLPSTPDFEVASQDTARFWPLPNPNDPQNPQRRRFPCSAGPWPPRTCAWMAPCSGTVATAFTICGARCR